jgi:hypothetical protein
VIIRSRLLSVLSVLEHEPDAQRALGGGGLPRDAERDLEAEAEIVAAVAWPGGRSGCLINRAAIRDPLHRIELWLAR